MFDDQTVKLQLLAALLDRFVQFDPGEKTPQDGPVSPASQCSPLSLVELQRGSALIDRMP